MRDVVADDLEHRLLDPAIPEEDALPAAARLVRVRAGVHRLPEQGDARLLPEPMAQEQGGVARRGDRNAARQLHGVVDGHELVGIDLHVELERRVERLQHQVVVRGVERVGAADLDAEVAAAVRAHGAVDLGVAGQRRHPVEAEVLPAERREDADGDGVDPVALRGLLDGSQVPPQVPLEQRQAVAFEEQGRKRHLHVELRELRLVDRAGAAQALEHLHGACDRPAVLVDQEELLLQADPPDAGLEPPLGEQLLERVGVGEEPLLEASQLLVRTPGLDVLPSHGAGS